MSNNLDNSICKIIMRILDERGYRYCERCDVSNTRFEFHHIVYRSEKPKHPRLNDEKNLIQLCRSCHNYYHEDKSRRAHLIEERNLVELFGTEILQANN